MTNKWKRFWLGVAIGAPVGFMAGCSAQGTLNANNIKPAVDAVTDEYVGYVSNDASLSESEKAKRITTGTMLKATVNKAAQPDEVVQ